MTVNDVNDLIRILKEHPEWRDELRRVLLTEELLQLPDLVRELVEIQRQQSQELAQIRATLSEVVQIQRQHSEMLAQHSQAIAQLAEAQRRTDERLEQLAEAQRRTEDRLEQLAEAQRRTDERLEQLAGEVRALAEAQRRTDERLEQLAEAQRRTEQQLSELIEAQRRTDQELRRLADWQRGEAGRREGERYERDTVRRAPNLFFGGEGGSPEYPHVSRVVAQWLSPYFQQQRAPDPAEDPLLSDIIWWKGDRVLVVEVSQKVNGHDVRRARQRANTLRDVGVDATPVVIGEEWATPESQAIAQQEGVEWMVSGGLSQGLLQFRRL
jgi:hypothetical protein